MELVAVIVAFKLAIALIAVIIALPWVVVLTLAAFFELTRKCDTWSVYNKWEQKEVETKMGSCKIPILYYKPSVLLGAFYLVDPAKAQETLPDNLEPFVLPIINKAIAGIFMMDYKETSIGPYKEMGLTVQAKLKGTRAWLLGYAWDMVGNIYHSKAMLCVYQQKNTGLYVNTLPVSTEGAHAAGHAVWGYNKYISNFEIDSSDPNYFSFRLGNEFSLTMKQNKCGLWWSGLPFLTYTIAEAVNRSGAVAGSVVRTIVWMGHKAWWGGAGSIKVEMLGGDGETARQMRHLGLDTASAVIAFRTDELQAHLPFGEQISSDANSVEALKKPLLK